MAHSSLRFGIGRFTTEAEVDFVVDKIVSVVQRLRDMRCVLSLIPRRIIVSYFDTILVRYGRWFKRALISTPSTGRSIKYKLHHAV